MVVCIKIEKGSDVVSDEYLNQFVVGKFYKVVDYNRPMLNKESNYDYFLLENIDINLHEFSNQLWAPKSMFRILTELKEEIQESESNLCE